MVQTFYEHPLIYSLFLGKYEPSKINGKTGRYAARSDLPSYIPRRNFALAVMDIVLPAGTTSGAAAGAGPGKSGAAGATVAAPVPAPVGTTVASPTAAATTALLRQAVLGLQNDKLKRALLPLVDAAGDNASQARENIEKWFDSAMDRVSGWYKRRVQWIVVFLGLLLAILSNADTITIADALSRDVSMRNSLVAAAQAYAQTNPATSSSASPDPSSTIASCKKDAGSPECRVSRNLTEIQRLGLPVGWDRSDPRRVPDNFPGWLIKALGILLTTFAISLGAPFWFDVLNKIIVVRSTVKPREKSPDEPPVDRA
jgi:hypothetical protein